MTRVVSPEFSLVAACAMAPNEELARRAEGLVRPSFDWSRWRQLAVHHSVFEMAGDRLERAVPGILPPGILREVREGLTRNLALHLAQAQETARLVRLLGEAGVRSIVLKGVPLARLLYPDHPEWRYSSDIDLMVDPRDVSRADAALRAGGHERTWPDDDMAARLSQPVISRFAKDYQFRTGDRTHYLELHWRLTHNPHVFACSFDELYAQTEETNARFGPMRSLQGPVLPGYLAWHALVDINHVVKWFADLCWLRRLSGEADDAANIRPRLPIMIAAQIEAALLQDAPRPASAQVGRLCREMDRGQRIDTRRSLSRLPHEVALTMLSMRMAPGLRAKLWFLWRILVDPRDAMALGGRELPTLAYAIAGPFLALARFLRRPAR